MTVFLSDGQKSTRLQDLPKEAWTSVTSDVESVGSVAKLYSVISWLYRCVSLRANAVMAMPYTLLQGQNELIHWTGTEFDKDIPKQISWLKDFPQLLSKTESSSCLLGSAYWENVSNLLGNKTFSYDWLVPSSINEAYNRIPGIGGTWVDEEKVIGELVGFWRKIPHYHHIVELEIEDVVYFWLPDYAMEVGPARNTPGRAVLQNAGVIHSMDLFLHGYFDRGLIKAFIGKYAPSGSNTMLQPPNADEVNRFKKFIRRLLMGVTGANNFEIFRSDFQIETIGEGIKELRDNKLNEDEKKSIATGMGVPLSKMDSTASTDANRKMDEVSFIEDTIIPEIGWIFQVLNEQIFEPMGMRIKAQPNLLRIMQEDEVQRSQSFAHYVGNGMSVEAAIAILGIDMPDGIEIKPEPKPIPPMLQPFTGQQDDDDSGLVERSAFAVLDLLDKRDETAQFKRWLKNRDEFDVNDFTSTHLTYDDKIAIAYKAENRDNDFIPLLDEPIIDEDSDVVSEVMRRFDRLFPRERTLLDAEVLEDA